ncbi:oxygen-insensitive NADPH nitroreductase [Oceanobacillus polygoni]|uniref:FMN reductase (NADPH) n=1 Tax=Oceanobacillus polygoni TaxID=1235259 RepID=A0A9X0YSC0_9BACI|nr:oxygen-insensitive NADPH nitroreductase [Oceanobacillus polygoni]MBP2077942.1 FMN reductase (NADPH) [Oceanobacillus polygoni]
MNQTIETILNHRSIRKFKDEALTKEQIHTIVKAAQQASTSSNVMAYTIIGITDNALKEELYKVSGHSHVKNNAHLYMFCGDLHRIYQLANADEKVTIADNLESTEQFIVATIDATLAAQNAALAAESMGLGICYIGSLRNDINRVNELLELPEHVIPLFGLVVGYPDHQPDIKPRLPLEAIYHENKYSPFHEQQKHIEAYDNEMKQYYETRSSNTKIDTWSDQMLRKFSEPTRMDVTPFVKQKGFNKK